MNRLGKYIKERRDSLGLSLRDLSSKSGLSHSYINKLERGNDPRTNKPVEPTIDTLKMLAKGLNISLEELMHKAGYIDKVKENPSLNYTTSIEKENLLHLYKEIEKRDDLQLLFTYVKELEPDSVKKIIDVIKMIKEKENEKK